MQVRRIRLGTLVLLVSVAANAAEFTPPDAAHFQALLQTAVDINRDGQAAVIPFYDSKSSKQLAHQILDKLEEQKLYVDDMNHWLAANHASNAEALMDKWYSHYQNVLTQGFEFIDDDMISVIWRANGKNGTWFVDRAACHQGQLDQLPAKVMDAQAKFIDANSAKLASALAAAYARELDREMHPAPGDRPIPELMAKFANNAFQEALQAQPEPDRDLLRQAFSYNPNQPALSPADNCDRSWLVAHFINDAKTKSAPLLRSNATQASFAQAFQPTSPPGSQAPPDKNGFRAGKFVLAEPTLLSRLNVTGNIAVQVHVNEQGLAGDVTIASSSLAPAKVTSIDGTEYESANVMLDALTAYFRDGTFRSTSSDGKAAAYTLTYSYKLGS